MDESMRERLIPFGLAAAAVAALGLADTGFRGFGDLIPGNTIPTNSVFLSLARDVNFDGSVVVGTIATSALATSNPQYARRFRWTSSGLMQVIPDPGGTPFEPTIAGVSDDGQRVTGTIYNVGTSVSRAYVQDANSSSIQMLMSVPIPFGPDVGGLTLGLAFSGDGNVVAGSAGTPIGAARAMVWDNALTMNTGGVLPAAFIVQDGTTCPPPSHVLAVSREGDVGVGYEFETTRFGDSCLSRRAATIWTLPAGPVGVINLGTDYHGEATAVSTEGRVVAGRRYRVIGPGTVETDAEWLRATSAGVIEPLGNSPIGGTADIATSPLDISADGKVIVGYVGSDAVMWDRAHGMRTVKQALLDAGVNIGGWRLVTAHGVSGNGRVIVGVGVNPAGQIEGWRAELPGPCLGDFNDTGAATIQDVFDFLVAYFAGSLRADVNGFQGVTVQDIFDFLAAWFAGC